MSETLNTELSGDEKEFFKALGERIMHAMKQSAKEDFTLETTDKHLTKNLDYMKAEGWIEEHSKE